MIKLIKKGICAVLCLTMLAGLSALPAHAAFNYEFIYNKSVTTKRSVPVGTRIRFQTPPLKKNEKLCYTAGNGEILHTFVAGKPIENADGTVRYQLGYECCKVGETGVYFNWDGKKHMIDSVQVVNDKPKEGFPLSTSFGQILANQKVEKIVVTRGDSFEKRQTTNAAQISRFVETLAPEGLYHDFYIPTSRRLGFLFDVDFYLKGQQGYYRYGLTYDFRKEDGFTAPLPTGSCVEENAEEVYKIIGNFYESLG